MHFCVPSRHSAGRSALEEPGTAVALRTLERFARRKTLFADYWARVDAGLPSKAPYRRWWAVADLFLAPHRLPHRIALGGLLLAGAGRLAWRVVGMRLVSQV